MKRTSIIITVVLATMALAVPAFAQEAESAHHPHGRGCIWAKGEGVATLDGKGHVQILIDGDVVIYDQAGDARVTIKAVPEGARAQDQPEKALPLTTTYTLDNFRGFVGVTGSDIRIELEGTMKFRGCGSGEVTVDGDGVWRSLRTRGTWNGLEVKFGGSEVSDSLGIS